MQLCRGCAIQLNSVSQHSYPTTFPYLETEIQLSYRPRSRRGACIGAKKNLAAQPPCKADFYKPFAWSPDAASAPLVASAVTVA